jgi:polysaccharide export outer membrane protein
MLIAVAAGSLFLAAPVPSSAQTAAASRAPTQTSEGLTTPTPTTDMGETSNPVSPGTEIYDANINYNGYVLGPGDSLSVVVVPQDRYSAPNLPVLQDGSLYYPGIGRIDAAGLTIDQLTEKITEGLSKYCINPFVTITMTALRQRVVYVTGGVTQPKVLDANAASTLAKAITLAGGPTDLDMLGHVTVLRGNRAMTSNMYDLLVKGVDNGENLSLQPGDVVIVPMNTTRITVLGAVVKPGQYGLDESGITAEGPERVADAISKAGGVEGGGVARISHVGLLRKVAGAQEPKLFVYDYGKYLKDGDMSQNPVIQDNDVIVVPESKKDLLSVSSILGYIPYYAFIRQMFP